MHDTFQSTGNLHTETDIFAIEITANNIIIHYKLPKSQWNLKDSYRLLAPDIRKITGIINFQDF